MLFTRVTTSGQVKCFLRNESQSKEIHWNPNNPIGFAYEVLVAFGAIPCTAGALSYAFWHEQLSPKGGNFVILDTDVEKWTRKKLANQEIWEGECLAETTQFSAEM